MFNWLFLKTLQEQKHTKEVSDCQMSRIYSTSGVAIGESDVD